MVLKKAYLRKIPTETKARKMHHDKLEDCNHNLTKILKSTPKMKKPTFWRTYIEKDIFDLDSKQAIFF